MFALDAWDETADYLILDDIEWQFVPNKKALFFGQKTFWVTDKYRKKIEVNWGKPVIYLCNPECEPTLDNSFSQNIVTIHINKLY